MAECRDVMDDKKRCTGHGGLLKIFTSSYYK